MAALTQLVNEQLQKAHIEPSFSPWNSPVFVIKRKSRKWRMLVDLRNVNNTMLPMGPLQPRLPSPSMVPKGWSVVIIDLQDCFFTIPLHCKDRKHFAFSVPSINHMAPGALGRPRGMVWGGRREEGSGWGTHVYLWQIHFDIWQNQYNIVKLNKIKF